MGMAASEVTEELHKAVFKALDQLQGEYGIAKGFTNKSGAVLVMEVCLSVDRNPCIHVCHFLTQFVRILCIGMEQDFGLSDAVFRGSLCAMEDSCGT
jgi:hypothetical protein